MSFDKPLKQPEPHFLGIAEGFIRLYMEYAYCSAWPVVCLQIMGLQKVPGTVIWGNKRKMLEISFLFIFSLIL